MHPVHHKTVCCSSRNTTTPGKPVKKTKVEEEEEDLTRDMEDPAPEPAVTEVTTGSKIQPSKGGNYMDLDEETTEKTEKTEGPVSVAMYPFISGLSCFLDQQCVGLRQPYNTVY